jgi:hypothetical protein
VGTAPPGPDAAGATKEEIVMAWKKCQAGALAALFALAVLCGVRAAEVKPTDEGKGEAFKGKTVEMKDKGDFAVILAFPAGKEVTATTKGDKETDVHLFVYDQDKKEVGKDTSPGPKFKLLVRNSGGDNKVTLEVKVAK